MSEAKPAYGLKDLLWKELELKLDLGMNGVAVTKEALAKIQPGTVAQEQVHCLFEYDFDTHDFTLPSGFNLPLGLSVPFRWNRDAAHTVTVDGERVILVKKGNEIAEIDFHPRPAFYGKKTSDGKEMDTIAILNQKRALFIVYSNECSYKEKGEDCLFCNINFTKDTYGEKEGIFWKTARQIGETAAEAFREGIIDHLTVTGGVIPERRELEYYLDVAEEIRIHTGRDDFNGTATVAAPLDLRNLDRLKEAGYRTTAMNLELWDKGFYDTICPGKARGGGGWDHWLKALEYAVGVFGRGRVRSNFVAGIEPKFKTLEGLEYLAEKGVVGINSVWIPCPGSGLEGHRSPVPAWYMDLAFKLVPIWKKAGFTFEQVCDANASSDYLQHDIWRIEDELLPIFGEAKAAS
ncbi:MAG TPA: radical SAM protein [Candidatus Deferrimicrobiaceae bacterium]|jgi:hypothetical protein